jgi:succinoglycan biosynthesis transport protein ExoP
MSKASGQLAPAPLPHPAEPASPALAAARSFPGAQPEQALFRFDLRRSLEMHRKLALGFAIFGVLLAASYLFLHWPLYNAEALVYIQPTPSAVGGVAMHWPYNYDPATYESYIQQQILSMTRPDVLREAMGKIDGWKNSGESDQDAIDRLGRAIEVERVQNSYQVSITAHARDAQMAANMANAVADAYIDSTRHEQKAGNAEREAMLRDERDRVKKELADDRAEQAQLNAQLGVAAIGAAVPEHFDDDIAKIHDQLVKARADHDEAEARLASVGGNGGQSAALDAQADEIASADPGLTSLKTALDARRAVLVSQMANLTPSHPLYKQDASELAKIDANLEKATTELHAKAASRVQEKLRTDLARTADIEAQLNGELGQMTRAAVGATPKLQRAADLVGDITRLQNRYDAIDELLQNQTIEDAAPERAHVTTAALPPIHPAEKGAIRNALVLLFGLLFLGMVAAVAAHKLDPRLYVASDVEQVLGFAPMAQLPDFGEVSEGVADEHLLRLSSVLEHARRRGHLKTCILTGTGPGTGTTTIATRVRALLEDIGRPAVLVDAIRADHAPAGQQTGAPRSTQSLALLQRLTDESKAQDETLVLTDTAPLTVSAETEYLARNADCAIVVMEAGVTTRTQLRATASALQRLDVGAVGFVLNRVGLAKADPAFRNSVRDMEHHVRALGRASSGHAVRTRRVEVVPDEEAQAWTPQTHAPAWQNPAPEQAMQVSEEEAAAATQPWQTAEATPPLPLHPVAQAPAPLPIAQPESDLPWWLDDKPVQAQQYRTPEPVVPVAAAQPVPPVAAPFVPAPFVPEPSVPNPAMPDPAVMESRLSGLRNLLSVRSPHPPFQDGMEAPWQSADADPDATLYAPERASWTPEPSVPASGYAASEPEPVPYLPQQPARWAPEPQWASDETVVDTPGLPVAGAASQVAGAAAQRVQVPVPEAQPVHASAVPPAAGRGSTPQVTTAPEFLPPRKTWLSRFDSDGDRRERRDTVDDVEILPSWRGQYRRKDKK